MAGIFAPVASPFGGQAARNTNDAAIGRGFGAPASTFTPSPQSLYPSLSPQGKAAALVQGDPGYVQAQLDANHAEHTAANTRQATIRELAVQTGLPPDALAKSFGDKYGDLDPATIQAAKDNQFSTYAQGQHTEQLAHDAAQGQLGATGGWESGANNIVVGNENYQKGLDLYKMGQDFGSAANSAVGAYTGALGTNQTNLTSALQSAEQTAATNPAFASAMAPPPGFNQTPPVRNNGLPIGGVPQHPTGGQSQFTPRLRRENF